MKVPWSIVSALQAPQERPHIFFFLSDDLGWNNVGFHNPLVHTPAIDSLRMQGIELSRHYAYKFCSPSRSSFLSGRLPVHVNEHNKITEAPLAGVPPNMTIIPALLKQAGYRTHHIGKWHAGFASKSQNIPVSRGFDSSLAFFHGAEDHYTQTCGGNVRCSRGKFTDLWFNDGPAAGLNGTDYSCHIWRDRALQILKEHDPLVPLFLFLAFANNHSPLQVPESYESSYPVTATPRWRVYQAMMTAVDAAVGQIIDAVRAKGMWENSLVVWTSDNGGKSCESGGNNFPLRGGKASNWEGGFRVPTVVSGGIVPIERRGATYAGITHFADWYATFSALAGVPAKDARAEAAGLPPVDGHDLRDALWKGEPSPWTNKPLYLASHAAAPYVNLQRTAVLMLDDYKLITNANILAEWNGQYWPNSTSYLGVCGQSGVLDCGAGCLFDVAADPGEHTDLAKAQPEKLRELQGLLERLAPSVYDPDRGDPGLGPCRAAEEAGGYWAPYLP